jgi:anti-anti-sigma factor
MLGAIVKLWKRVCQRGGRLALCNVSENVSQVLHITKLHAIWPIYGSREQALSAVGE